MTDYPTPNQHTGRNSPVRLIVLHSTETPAGTARAVARNFQAVSARASSHWIVGTDATVSGVAEADTAWAAPGANADGIQVEQCGYASSTDWTHGDGATVVAATARLVAQIADRWSIPLRHLTNAELAAGASGIVTHAQVSVVYKKSDHTDPGPMYPVAAMLTQATGTIPTPTTELEDLNMQIVTTTANKGQWLLTGDGTLVGMPNTEYVRVAIRMCDKKMTGLNQREVDVLKDITRRIKEARA